METSQVLKQNIDFVPVQNDVEVCARIKQWMKDNLTEFMKPGCRVTKEVESCLGGITYLELGGYITNPFDPEEQVSVEATLNIEHQRQLMSEDPEGTRWYSLQPAAKVTMPGYNASAPQVAALRAELLLKVARLACEFNKVFGDTKIWLVASTKAERDARDEAILTRITADAARLKVADALKQVLSRAKMRVGAERHVNAPFDVSDLKTGTYDVTVQKKSYTVQLQQCNVMVIRRNT